MKIEDHLDKLKIFIAVAESGSINSAAQGLALSQPAITRAIQTLEQALGFKLFNRDRYGMHLTEGGHIFQLTAARALKELRDAAVKAANSHEVMSGNLGIGTYESLAEYLWPDFLLEVQQLFPLLNISLKTNSQQGHLAELQSGLLDFVVDAEPRNQASLTLWPLYADQFSFYSRDKIKLNRETSKTLSLLSVREVFDEENVTLEQHVSQMGLSFQREYYFDSFTTAMRMAAKGVGVTILPQRLVGSTDDRLHIVKAAGAKEGFGAHKIYATVSPHREKDQRVKTLVKLLKKQLSSRVN